MQETIVEKTPEQIDQEQETRSLGRINSKLKNKAKLLDKDGIVLDYLQSHKIDQKGFEMLSWVDVSIVARGLNISSNKALETLKSLFNLGAIYRSALNSNVFMAKYK